MMEQRPKLILPDLAARKAADARLAMVAVGEAMSAAWAERACAFSDKAHSYKMKAEEIAKLEAALSGG